MRLILRVGYRRLGVVGTALLVAGAFPMTLIGAESSQIVMMVFVALMGIGMGLSIPSFLVAVQTTVERRHLGTATSTIQFSRSIGGTLGVSVMGAALSARLASNLSAAGLDPKLVSRLLDPVPGSQLVIDSGARLALADAIHVVFVIAFIAALLGLAAVFFTPRGELKERVMEGNPSTTSMD
jgi:MFS family permease